MKKKCCVKDCINEGIPQQPYDFYVCDSCCAELQRRLNQLATDKFLQESRN